MKKKFKVKMRYGDSDWFENLTYITEDENEINFLTFFLEKYDEDLFLFYVKPDSLKYIEAYKDDKQLLISTINDMATLLNIAVDQSSNYDDSEKVVLLAADSETEEIHKLLSEIMGFISLWIGWTMYHVGYNGYPQTYSIEDISGRTEITKEIAIAILKEKLNMDVIFID